MNRFKIIVPLFIGIFTYSFAVFLLGPRGIWAMHQLEVQKTLIQDNVSVLLNIQHELSDTVRNLTADPDTLSVYAHDMGYIYEGERLIKLSGYSGGIQRTYFPGTITELQKPHYCPEWFCKLFGLCIAGLYLSIQYILSKKRLKSVVYMHSGIRNQV